MEHEVETIFTASPDYPDGEVRSLSYETVPHEQGLAARFVLPRLDVWTMVAVKFKNWE
ncbi:hypothetical protein D3C71_2100030 [compost metagenome]